MNIYFENLNDKYRPAITDFLRLHNINEVTGGYSVKIQKTDDKKIKIEKNTDSAILYISQDYQLFRALLKLRSLKDEYYEENIYFDTLCAMFDGSQASSVMNLKSVKRMMLYLASMGFNMMMLYTEDCYEISGEPDFGNMRPRYTQKDFRELDAYANSLGIELVGCIQTLGHLTDAIRRPKYAEFSDRPDILMVGEKNTYELIEKMIKTMSENLTSRRIHLGLDEAWDLGRGNYLLKHGIRNQTDMMAEHLQKVCEIAKKYGMHPMMWADSFFRCKSETFDMYDTKVHFSQQDKNAVPADMGLVYWDYYHTDKDFYKDRLNECGKLTEQVIFAGCSRNVRTFGCHLEKTIVTSNPALTACKESGVKEILATVWGDDHRESSTFATLPGLALFAEHMYKENPTMEDVKTCFSDAVEISWDALYDIDFLDSVPEFNGKNPDNTALSRIILWQDILLGLYDKSMENCDMTEHYKSLAERMLQNANNETFGKMFKFYSALSTVLSEKQYLGIRLYNAYQNKNISELKKISEEILPKLYNDTKILRHSHREHFFDEYKPIGWEILDIRYGGLLMRIDTTKKRLDDFISGKIEKIDELEEERLPYTGKPDYQLICSASRL